MVKKGQIQDAEGNIVYWHTSSDIVFDEETGNTVKEDIDAIKSALGMIESGPSVSVKIDASTLQGHDSDYFAANEAVEEKFLKKEEAATTYLASTDAADTYLGKSDAASTYLTKTDASSTYATKTELTNKILYGTSVPSSLEEGQLYLVYE